MTLAGKICGIVGVVLGIINAIAGIALKISQPLMIEECHV